MFNNILEISKRSNKGGRVAIRIALLKIHDNPTDKNKNGIHWNEEYVKNAMDSAKMIPICAEFIDDDKSVPFGHGLTETVVNDEGIKEPLFLDSETVGSIESVSIEEFEKDGSTIKLLCGNGYLYSQRYPNFVKWVRTNYALGVVDTSIEIVGKEENDNKIVYEEEKPTDEFRTPMEFEFSGTAILSLSPADDDAIVLEVAQKQDIKKEEQHNMEFDMNEVKSVIQSTIVECNSKETEFTEKINELNEQLSEKDTVIAEKDEKISELNASVNEMQKVLDKMKDDQKTYWAEREILEKEIAKAKVAEKLGELDSALGEFNEEEKEICKEDIEELKKNICACKKKEELNEVASEINSIKSKICMAIVEKQKKAELDAKVTEQNSKKDKVDVEDIFSEMCEEAVSENDNDINIF